MKLALLLLLSCLSLTSLAKEDLSKLNPITGRAFIKADNVIANKLVDLQLELQIQEGFFAYHDKFRMKIKDPVEVPVGELNISPLVEFQDSVSGKIKKGLSETGTIETQIQIPANLDETVNEMIVELTYIACTKKFCLTPRILKLTAKVPRLISTADTKSKEDIASSGYIQRQIDENFGYALALIFLFGLLTSLTPCVYPLIPITLAVLGSNKQRSQLQSFLISVSYVLGIGITYAILGVIAAQTGQLFGSLISHPIVIVTMSLIFIAMGLSLLGLFELQAPAFIRNRTTGHTSQKGMGGAFFSGLLAGVVASPCVGPVLVGVLAYIAKTQNSALGFILLFTFAMGFGVLFILLGTFSQLANKLPRSGAWMNTVKTLLALALFAMAFWYSWPLIKKVLPENKTKTEQVTTNKVQWQSFSPALVESAKKEGKPVIIDFYADWCAACVEMDKFTFVKAPIIEKSKEFVMLKVDATEPFDELVEWQQTYEVYGLPTMIFIDASGKVRDDLTLTGFEEAPAFLLRMEKVLKK